eukprot:862243-Pyramimonas_sp.AAC.2
MLLELVTDLSGLTTRWNWRVVATDGVYHWELFRAPCIENSRVPGLIGIQSLERNGALIRCKTGEIWFLGPGGAKIEASPGS